MTLMPPTGPTAQEWFSAAELAGLRGLPSTDRRVREKAKRDGWESRKRSFGKGLEYHIASLPEETRVAICKARALAAAAEHAAAEEQAESATTAKRHATREQALVVFNALPAGYKKDRARAREFILLQGWRFIDDHQLQKTRGILTYCDALKTREIPIPAKHAAYLPHQHGVPNLDRATFLRWESKYRELGLMGLVDGYTGRKSKIDGNDDLKRVVLGCLLRHPHITAKKIKAYIEAAHPDLNIVSISAIERWVANWKDENAQLWTYVTNPDKWKNVYLPAFGDQHEQIERLNQLWELDSTPGDWMLTDGRHSVLGVIDLQSRRLKLLVSKTSKALAVCQVFRRAVLEWGVPEGVRTDNGKDYVSEQFSGALRELEIPQQLCVPFASEQKGTIERSLQTMSHGILDLLPGFIGHNVAERKIIEARKSFAQRIMQPGETVEVALSSEQLQAVLDKWVEHVYHHDAHSGLDGRTPWQVATAWNGPVRRIHNERALDMLLAEVAGTRTIGKQGIQFERHLYVAGELGPYIGEEVQLRRDEQDIGRLYVYRMTGEFLCIAEAPRILGISPAEAAAAAKAHAKKVLAAQRDELKAAKRTVQENITEVVIAHRVAESEKLAALPRPGLSYSTAGLNAAAEAAQARDGQPTAPATVDADRLAAFQATFEQPAKVLEIEDPRRLHAYWLRVGERVDNGHLVNDEERNGWEIYRHSDQYRSQQAFFEEFGLSAEHFT
jgi:putative transposase